jgi:hypothetical protein
MKYISLIVLTLILSYNLLAQNGNWTTPVPITDDESINRNGKIQYLSFYDGPDFYIFWEKSFDSQSTNIYCRKFDLSDEEQVVLESSEFHYKNIQFLPVNTPSSSIHFLMFYETDINGNWDIYYKEYGPDGFSDPVEFAVTEYDDQHLRISLQEILVWESNQNINSTKINTISVNYTFDPVQTVDEGGCAKPTITRSEINLDDNYIVYHKETNTEYVDIYYAKYNYDTGTFDSSQFLTQEMCTKAKEFNLSYWNNYDLIVWNHFDGEAHRTAFCNLSDGEIHMGETTTDAVTSPTIHSSFIAVKTYLELSTQAIIKVENELAQVFVNPDLWSDFDISTQNINLSNNDVNNKNPKMYFAPAPSGSSATVGLGLLYEANFNNNWQIWLSRNWYINGGIYKESSDFEASIRQNPVQNNDLLINMNLSNSEKISFEIFSSAGKQLHKVDANYYNAGNHQKNIPLINLKSGSYILLITGESGQLAKQFIKL